ncbi:pyridoxal phosphate-dependent aminotransferase [Alkaliphilus serpentinus]|uniref:Histidinol-phosphate aminotransferase family protein n=1 Tax=Alkaliphilus serpentinus TaxID=1482731 RepID=A0A833HR96_9FIRM|nr:histidinol-phosphate transaminase [Alkaliphilus serpentinus]KAB3532851.1 histidinol-phosphate aminotransferase family protein [Alkaliphilus serpentinus]
MKHGGDTLSFQHLYNGEILDFSSNINPLGPPEGLKEYIMEAFDDLRVYPDIQYRHLKEEIAQYLGCGATEVVVGNGAMDIIHTLCILFDRVIVPYPSFIEYIEQPQILGKEVVKVKLSEDFEIQPEELLPHLHRGNLLILGNPNNPTGKRISKDVLISLHQEIKEKGAFLVLDEVFWEFCDMDYDSIQLFRGSNHVCVLRAATKFFALPGIRLGYGYTSEAMAKEYHKGALPWSVNTFADAAGRRIFRERDYIEKSKRYMAEERNFMLKELKIIKPIKVFQTHCNFILIQLLQDTEEDLFNHMIKEGIMIRKASTFEGLDNRYIRIAIKDRGSNLRLIESFKHYFKHQ